MVLQKNGIKGAAETTVAVDEVTLNVTAVNNGIASDDKVIIDGGIIDVTAGNEGIKSEPENTVDETTGEVTLEDTVSAGAITINNGSFDITTNGGYTTTLNDSSDSCKGLKATSTIIVNDGNFTINSADDAIHTNEYIYLLGGTFDVKTGDDGVHADTSLFIGEENAENEKLNINVTSSYEALEAGTIYCYSGNVNVTASDDGINAAGGSSNGSDQGNGFNNNFRPGGGGRPGFGGQTSSNTGDYSINIYGGNIYVNSNGDGLDSNGAINVSGGEVIVFGAAAGSDNAPYDCESQFNITGGTVFGAGSSQMAVTPASSQKYAASRTNISQGKNIVVSDSGANVLFATEAIKNVNYVIYSSSELESGKSYTISGTSNAVATVTPTVKATATPTVEATVTPTVEATATPTAEATATPIAEATAAPTQEPTATVEPTKAPESVKKISVQVTSKNSSSLTVKWEKVAGTTYYEIYRAASKNGTYKKIKTINNADTTSYTNSKLKCGTTYYYVVKSYKKDNGQNTCIGESEVSSGKVVPAKTTIKKGTSKNNEVTLKWKKVSGVSGYEVYRAASKNGKYKKVTTVTKASKVTYTNKNLKTGKKYYYKIRTYKTVNGKKVYGEYSAVKSVKVK